MTHRGVPGLLLLLLFRTLRETPGTPQSVWLLHLCGCSFEHVPNGSRFACRHESHQRVAPRAGVQTTSATQSRSLALAITFLFGFSDWSLRLGRRGGECRRKMFLTVFAIPIDFDWPKTERRMLFDPNAMSGASCNFLGAGTISIDVEVIKIRKPYVLLVQMRIRRVSKCGKVVIHLVRGRFPSMLR